jgi:hypothetical protein
MAFEGKKWCYIRSVTYWGSFLTRLSSRLLLQALNASADVEAWYSFLLPSASASATTFSRLHVGIHLPGLLDNGAAVRDC